MKEAYGKTSSNSTNMLLYASEKLGEAVQRLATHPSDVRHRLMATGEFLAIVPTKALPPPFRRQFDQIWKEMTKRRPPNPEMSRMRHTLRTMRNATGEKIAAKLFSLNSELDDYIRHTLCSRRTRQQGGTRSTHSVSVSVSTGRRADEPVANQAQFAGKFW